MVDVSDVCVYVMCVSGPLLGGVVSQWVPSYHELSCIEHPNIDGKRQHQTSRGAYIIHRERRWISLYAEVVCVCCLFQACRQGLDSCPPYMCLNSPLPLSVCVAGCMSGFPWSSVVFLGLLCLTLLLFLLTAPRLHTPPNSPTPDDGKTTPTHSLHQALEHVT